MTQNWNYKWHHVAGIYDGKAIRIFLDGKQAGIKEASGNLKRTIHPVTIGKNHERDAENQPGFISNSIFDDVRIYKKAILPEKLGFYSQLVHENEDLILYLKLDEIEERDEEFLSYGATPSHSATMDGIIFSDRTFQPESFQAKISHTPVLFEIKEPFNNDILIKNIFHFSNLGEYLVRWRLMQDTTRLQEGSLKENIAAQEQKYVTLPVKEIDYVPGVEYRLVLSLELDQDTWWAKKGYEITFKEFHLPNMSEQEPLGLTSAGIISYDSNENTLSIHGSDFSYEVDVRRGIITKVAVEDVKMALNGPQLNVFRPWIVNEISHWTRAEFDEWYEWGLDSLIHEVEKYEVVAISPSQVDVLFIVLSTSFVDRTIQFLNHYNYAFHASGDLILEHTVIPNVEFPARRPRDDIHWIQKIGLQFKLDKAFNRITWYGKGPIETYPDRKDGAKTGIYKEEFDNIHMPYIIPQDFGNKTDVKWLFIENTDGKGIAIFTDKTCNISINPYDNLGSTWYPYQLKRNKSSVTLNVDHKVSGVGGTPITVRQPYRTYPVIYNYRLRFKLVDRSEESLIDLGKQKF